MNQAELNYSKAGKKFEQFRPKVKKVQKLIRKYEADNEKLCEYLLTSNYRDIFVQDAKNTESLLVAAHTIKELVEKGATSQIISNSTQNFNLLFSLSVLSNVGLLETSRNEADCKKSRRI